MTCHQPAVPAMASYPASRAFSTSRPMAPSLPRGRHAAPSPHLLLGSAVTDVCSHASLSGRGDAWAKSISLHAGILLCAAETCSGKQQQHPQTQLRFPKECCAFAGEMPRQRGFRCMRVSTTARLGSGKQQQPAEHFSANAVLSQRLWLGANSTLPLLPQRGFSRFRKEELRESWCHWALLSGTPCSRPGFTLPSLTKQTQPQPCSSMHNLGWHSMHTTISRCRHRLAFYSCAQMDSRTRPVLSPQERRGDRIPAHRPCTE